MRTLLDPVVRRQLAAQERALGGVSLAYLRDMWRVAPRAFVAVIRARPFLGYPARGVPPAAYHVARIAATRVEDCGTCVQTAVHLARAAGVPPAVIRAAALGAPEALPADLSAVYRFATAVAQADTAATEAERPALRARFSEHGLVTLAIAIAGARTFPALKRALGHATSCERLALEFDAPTQAAC